MCNSVRNSPKRSSNPHFTTPYAETMRRLISHIPLTRQLIFRRAFREFFFASFWEVCMEGGNVGRCRKGGLPQCSNNPQTILKHCQNCFQAEASDPVGRQFCSEAGRCLWGQLPGNPTLLHAALPETRSAGIRGVLGIQVCGILWPWLEISTVPLFYHFCPFLGKYFSS